MALPAPSSHLGPTQCPAHRNWPAEGLRLAVPHHSHDFTRIDHGPAGLARLRVRRAEIPAVKLHEQRALQTHRHAMSALDVSQINWRTTGADSTGVRKKLGELFPMVSCIQASCVAGR